MRNICCCPHQTKRPTDRHAVLTFFRAHALRTLSYFWWFISLPKRMLLRMVPGNTQGSWAAYVSCPLTFRVPESWGSSPRMALSREDCQQAPVFFEKKKKKALKTGFYLGSFAASHLSRVKQIQTRWECESQTPTFPAPTGPITVRSWCDLMVKEMFCRDGASKLWGQMSSSRLVKKV